MTELPGGTVTFVFTDIEGSTRLLASLGSQYEALLADHRKLLRNAFSSHGGIEIDTQGDAFFYAFAKAHDALAGTIAAQRALASHPRPQDAELRVRMGIHTGEPTVTQEGYVGGDVHLGARICAAAWGEQILVSDATTGLVADNRDASLRDLGEHTLKDIEVPVRLHQVVARGLRADFPPPRTASHPTNLPPTLDPLVGRAEDISELTSLLTSTEVRVVTLTGPGGVGKTRLSLAAGQELLSSFSDGVFFVDLSALSDPALVTGAITGALGLRESPGRSLTETLADYLASRHTLLILDNLEHLLDAATDLSVLLASAPSLKVLVTSREPLRIAGEHEIPLAPLGLPPEDVDASVVLEAPAVELFVTRARALRPGFEISAEEASSVAAICRRLDGLPLAIELAAARTKVLSLRALATRLDQSLAALGRGRRDASARQRTLRGAIEWSYDLLTVDEQTLFRRIGVFAGGFTLEAAEQVCGPDDPSLAVLDGIASLVDKSLVRAHEHEDRFVMLETIREFALERLEESGEAEDIRRAHAEFFRVLADEAWWNLIGPEAEGWVRRLDDELPNMRATLEYSVTHAAETALATAGALWRYWWARGHLKEGQTRLRQVLRLATGSAPARARALRGLGAIAQAQGATSEAAAATHESLSLYEELGDVVGQAACWETLALLAVEEGDFQTARERFKLVRRLCAEAGDEVGVSAAIGNLANVALLEGEQDEAYRLAQESMKLAEKLGHTEGVAQSLINMGLVRLGQESLGEALELLSQGLTLAQRLDHTELIAVALEGSAAAAAARGELSRARSLLNEADGLRERSGHVRGIFERRVYSETLQRLQIRQDDVAGTPE